MANNILRYTSRDFESIKNDLIDAIPSLTSLWTSREEGDPGIVLIKLMSALGDMLSFTFDKQALEYYAPTVTQRKNASKLFELIGYKMHWYQSALTTVTLTYQANIDQFIGFYKRIVDGENVEDVYFDYRTRYIHDANDTQTDRTISLPPVVSVDGTNIPLLPDMTERFTIHNIQLEEPQGSFDPNTPPPASIKTDTDFKTHAVEFAEMSKEVYRIWQENNKVGLHTYIQDPELSIELYSNNYSEPVYSLIPQTKKPEINSSGTYDPTIYLYPYQPLSLPALQGSLCSTNFNTSMLKDNCFYLPDSNVDDSHLYLGYRTIDTNTQSEITVFITKVDNLLTASDGELHFQFGVDEFDYPYIELSSYWKNKVGEDTVTFTLYYFRTMGQYGNITKNYLKQLNVPYSTLLDITNVENTDYNTGVDGTIVSSPGYNPQTASQAYKDSLNYIMTYDTIVTIYDFTRFTRRQPGISNAFACDGQHAKDLNDKLLKSCNSYTRSQLINILGTDINGASTDLLAKCLYNIRKINYSYTESPVTIADSQKDSSTQPFINYAINIYPIVKNYSLYTEDNVSIATFTNRLGSTSYPYMLYKIKTSYDDDVTIENTRIETQLDNAFEDVKVANVKPFYTACRVFNWRACGTVHLTKSVSKEEADKIVSNIITTLSNVYSVSNLTFGQRINYMELIDIITSSDDRIRYFDAGVGDKKLVDFENLVPNSNEYFSPEAYFNDESIMRYCQTVEECVQSPNSPYYNYIYVDPQYILS